MSINDSPTVAIGTTLPFGSFENGKLFLKLDGISDGLYVFFNSSWLLIGKITMSEQMRFSTPTVFEPTTSIKAPNSIKFGGNF